MELTGKDVLRNEFAKIVLETLIRETAQSITSFAYEERLARSVWRIADALIEEQYKNAKS